ncbi:MAG: hypothetical protein HY812_12010 [Planctomycetes bacterium]|nr:hypothetical protein [Planctomycetota bacterium]
MSNDTDAALPRARGRAAGCSPSAPAAGAAAKSVLDAIPLPLLVRSPAGQVAFANGPARELLRLTPEEAEHAALTLIQQDAAQERPLYLLVVAQTPQRTIEALRAEVEVAPGELLEVLLVEPCAGAPLPTGERLLGALDRRSDAVRRATNALLWQRAVRRCAPNAAAGPRLAGGEQPGRKPERSAWLEPRGLAARLLRRVRRFLRRGRQWQLVADVRLERGDRAVRADEVAVAQVILSGLDLLAAGACGGALALRATEVGCRLRIVLDASGLEGNRDAPDLRGQSSLVRSLAPILKAHEATLEIHRDGRGSRRVIFTMPTVRRRDALERRD